MDTKKLERWAQQLLDTGKRNNLVNFKDTKASTAEVVFPDTESFYEKCLSLSTFEVYDPKIEDNEVDEEAILSANVYEEVTKETVDLDKHKKSEYVEMYSTNIRKNNQILVYAKTPNPITAIKNIDKKSRDFLEETGVNVAYMAFGFIHWKESEQSNTVNRAPLLLVPITLKRESSIEPYYIKLTEDDVVVNPTFSYLMEAQYGVKLPDYEEDENLTSYLDKVKQIVARLHWEVTSECKIGVFSFLKINMYHDLKNNSEEILKNNNVRLLLGEDQVTSDAVLVDEVNVVENEIIDLHTVVDADSSQIEAIEMAKTGKSFVLQGPPGTGKSQTITNIIAECLHDGKKVLFVSEKLAALNVVYDKLKKADLADFCLELHSYKSSKKEVIKELCKTLKADRSAVSDRAELELNAKIRLQEQLDSYANKLHEPQPVINKSLYQMYEAHYAHRKAPDLDLILDDIVKKDENYLNDAVNLLEQYEKYVLTIGEDYRKNEWFGYKGTNGSYETQNKLKQGLKIINDGLGDLVPKADNCRVEYDLELNSLSDAENYIKLLNVLSSTTFLKPETLTPDKIHCAIDGAKKLKELSDRIIPIRQNLDKSFEADVYKINGQDYYNKLTKLYSGLFSRMFNAEYKSMVTDLRLASRTGKKPSYTQAKDYMKLLMSYQELMNNFLSVNDVVAGLFTTDSIDVDTDWNKLLAELEVVNTCFGKGLSCGSITDMSDEQFAAGKPGFDDHAVELGESLNRFKPTMTLLQEDFDTNFVRFDTIPLEDLQIKMQSCEESADKIENWVRFYTLLKQLEERDLLTFVNCAIENKFDRNQIADSYQRLFYKEWINHVIYANPVFSGFTRISQDRAVEQFVQKDKLQFEISKAQIKAELSAKRPSLDLMAGGSAVSILLREGEKKRKIKSIRKLLEEIGELVQVLKPCFLMSPLSVSTFLSSNSITFDTVVFDEASQIFPQDAIGAIYRGKQLIVVGDSKQMPPSNFFNSSMEIDDDDEETGDVTDFESILDLCSTTLPQMRLRWHYRSHYEQLISFSNKNFYDNALVTFPSSVMDHEGVGVDYYKVDGLFDRKSHTNRKEAEYVVDLVYKNIEQYPKRSLGVVAFSVAQQELIERLLDKKRQEDSSKEWFFKSDESIKEPFFIKNLETVQGDERDTIIFSVAYGMDSQDRLLHNFGPLNRMGGERRLNVAVTRAKDNVQLVSSMHGTDIDLKRTSAEGARLLREYLDYAENGEVALERSISVNPFEQFDSEFEMDVCDFLREKGFSVDTQVGCSGFRIDMALKKPDSSDYVLAIECDGATYHSSKNARDRDRLRQEVLERMGWRFYRIWSTDWFRNSAVEKERLLETATRMINLGPGTKVEESKPIEEPVIEFNKTIETKHVGFPEYKEADIFTLRSENMHSVKTLVKRIMETEAPISEEYLLKRMCFIYNREHVTSVVRDRFEESMRGCESIGIERRNGFLYWADKHDYVLRVPGVKRDIKYIAPEELAAGLFVLIKQNVTVDKEGLYKTLVNMLGFSRVGDAIYDKLDEALDLIINLSIDGNMLSLKQ
ncbi:MAG: DUF4011 domain-containing protein [Lachnospiraceae bacterium]|nr:DUF4011 domain-containing protein [Lachnospiraceae bacterium]